MDAGSQGGSRARDDRVRTALQRAVDRLGPDLETDPARVRRALGDLLPDDPLAVSALTAVSEAGVLARLRADRDSFTTAALTPRAAAAVTARSGIDERTAAWAVGLWCAVLGLDDPPGAATTPDPGKVDAATVRRPEADVTERRPAAATARRPVPAEPAPPAAEPLSPPPVPADPSRPGRRRLVPIALLTALIVVVAGGAVVGARLAASSGARPTASNRAAATTPAASASTPPASASPSPAAPAAFRVVAHRGGGEHVAEETTAAIVAAGRSGYAAETDMRWTSDQVPVLVHDAAPGVGWTCTGGAPQVERTTWAQLSSRCRSTPSASPDGRSYPVARVDDTAEQLGAIPGAQWFVEAKTAMTQAQLTAFFDILERDGLVQRTVVTSFEARNLEIVRQGAEREGMPLRLLRFVSKATDVSAAQARSAGYWAVAIGIDGIDAAAVRALHGAGLKAMTWTPNTTAQWGVAKRAGVDQVITDDPDAWLRWADA